MNTWQIIISNLGFYSIFTMSEEITVRETGCLQPLDRPIVDLGLYVSTNILQDHQF